MVNEQTSVKVANESSLSTDDEDEREVLYFTNTCYGAHQNLHQKIERFSFQLLSVDNRNNYTIVAK